MNPVANKYIHETNKGVLGITGHFVESPYPAIGGNLFNSSTSEWINKKMEQQIKSFNHENK
ncbi:hypothetical protein GYM75_12095 [Gilliamella sp. ESL0441]|uniref:hypothetical protein n=1 Tax=Gilliamella sp. ESL0441 TaxID=2704654 RepID=UPI001C69719C|nr:hypothetical protein [Gilliamella sp. ESL0441]QYN45520.1 hypothetical protein GYM75_12095 [Gilliamella sp. ESL0441]